MYHLAVVGSTTAPTASPQAVVRYTLVQETSLWMPFQVTLKFKIITDFGPVVLSTWGGEKEKC